MFMSSLAQAIKGPQITKHFVLRPVQHNLSPFFPVNVSSYFWNQNSKIVLTIDAAKTYHLSLHQNPSSINNVLEISRLISNAIMCP